MAANMMKRAIRNGMEADYVLADAWFGTKPMMCMALELDVCTIRYLMLVHNKQEDLESRIGDIR